MSCSLTQQICEELGGRDRLGSYLVKLPPNASNLHQGQIPRSQADLSRPHIKSN